MGLKITLEKLNRKIIETRKILIVLSDYFRMLSHWRKFQQHNILGYNSAKFDLQILVPYIVDYGKRNKLKVKVLKRGNAYLSLTIDTLIFKGTLT